MASSTGALSAGRELDVLVAEKVMGWEPLEGPSPKESDWFKRNYWETWKWYRKLPASYMLAGMPAEVPRYSTDIEHAWDVVEAMAEGGEQVVVTIQPTGTWPNEGDPADPEKLWSCSTGISGTDMCWRTSYAPTAPLAICRAALDGLRE